jgi:hypothetical protein
VPRSRINRLAVTLTPDSRAALERLSEASGIAASQFVAKLVHDSIPVLEAMTRAFAVAKENPGKAVDAMGAALEKAMVEAAQMHLSLSRDTPGKKLRRRP